MYVYCSEQTAETNFLSYNEIFSKFDIFDNVGQYSIKSGDLFTFCLKINRGHQDCIELSCDRVNYVDL